MSWKEEVDRIERQRALAREQGGREAVDKQHARGRLTVRERIETLCDAGSFEEVAPLAGHAEREDGEIKAFTPANYVLGVGRIQRRHVAVGGEDFTIRGGSPSVGGLRKSVFAETLALRYRIPLVRLLEGGGGSVTGSGGKDRARTPGPDGLNTTPRFLSIMRAMQEVPVASAALGPVAGMPAARLAASHFSVMVKDTSQVMVAGPALVERALGTTYDKETLGGHQVHGRSSVVHNVTEDETAALAQIRDFLSYLPSHTRALPERGDHDDPIDRQDDALLSLVPRNRRRVYSMRKLLASVLDRDSFFEMGHGLGRSQITGLARLNGYSVGVLANDPMFYAGAMTAEAAEKLEHLVDLCDRFHLPILSFVDQPGFMIGPEAERSATIRRGTAAIFAVMQSRVPWASVLVRKAYGVASAAHFGPGGLVLAWPSAEAGALPVEGGVAVAFRREIQNAEDPEAVREKLEGQLGGMRDPFPRADDATYPDLIDPRQTRPRLCRWLELALPSLEARERATDMLRP